MRLSIEPGYGLVGGFIPRGGGLLGPRTRFGFFSIVVYVLAGFSVAAVLAAFCGYALAGCPVFPATGVDCPLTRVNGGGWGGRGGYGDYLFVGVCFECLGGALVAEGPRFLPEA